MAKGNMFLGMSRGSVGDVTFYRGRGQQLARARNRAPKNPRSSAQIIQRMILATASRAYSRMKTIVDHSFQGVTYGGESQSYFLKRNMERIRNYVAASLDMYPASITNPLEYVGLAEPNDAFESGLGLLVSQGTIPSIPVIVSTKEVGGEQIQYVSGFGQTATYADTPTVQNVLDMLGASAGDQITVVALSDSGVLYRSRYVIKAEATATELAEEWDQEGLGNAFDANKTEISSVVQLGYADANSAMLPVISTDIIGSAIIISRKVNNVWERSTQYLVPMAQDGVGQNVQAIIDLWNLGTTQIGADSPYYLNNADD